MKIVPKSKVTYHLEINKVYTFICNVGPVPQLNHDTQNFHGSENARFNFDISTPFHSCKMVGLKFSSNSVIIQALSKIVIVKDVIILFQPLLKFRAQT